MIKEVGRYLRPQIIILSSIWCTNIAKFVDEVTINSACIITCAIEAAVKSLIHLVSYFSNVNNYLFILLLWIESCAFI